MLAYILAIALAIASLSLYLSAFFVPEIHRKDDFLWSGVGLFYALVLWICAGRITGSVLLGQGAAVVLILSFAWQTVGLRRAQGRARAVDIAHPEEQTNVDHFSVMGWLQSRFSNQKVPSSTVKVPAKSSSIESPISPSPKKTEKETNLKEKEDVTQLYQTDKVIKEEVTIPFSEALDHEDDLDFEPFITDNEAETVIEMNQPPDLNSLANDQKEFAEEFLESLDQEIETTLETSEEKKPEPT